MHFQTLLISILYLLFSQCGESDSSENPAQDANTSLIPTGQIAITGDLVNGESADNVAALKEQKSRSLEMMALRLGRV